MRNNRRKTETLLIGCCLLIQPAINLAADKQGKVEQPQAELRFDRDVRPILSDKCFHCHGPDAANRAADLRLDIEESARTVLPKDATKDSEFARRIWSHDADEMMPPPDAKKPLTLDEQELLARWLEQGAQWTGHWSLATPVKPPLPSTSQSLWPLNEIDAFVLSKLEQHGLSPSEEAERSQLLRRVTLDLTGLLPSIEQLDAFLADDQPGAYERAVDRLLASPSFGQRMAVMWLDAARYGDTSVYHADGPRDMWAWRDAVVSAYNDNMPFDQFTIAQLAGDLIPEATLRQKILSGFNRNNGTTDEGGAIAEEYRVEYAVDRVKTTATVWLGLTMECGQCHDHKYDPISQEDYYSFYAFFNVSADAGMQTRNGNAAPLVEVADPAKEKQIPAEETRLASIDHQIEQCKVDCRAAFQQWQEQQRASIPENAAPKANILDVDFNQSEGKTVHTLKKELTGKIKGKAAWVKTAFDMGLELDGSNYVDFGDVASFQRSQSFSYGGWFEPSAAVGAAIAKMDDANSYRGFDLYVGASPISVHLVHSWPGNAIKVTTKQKLKKGQRYHVLVTYDGSSTAAGVTIYVDGKPWDWDIEQDCLTGTIQTEKSLLVGSRHPGSRYRGVVDAVQIFDRCLNASEVEKLASQNAIADILAIDPAARSAEQSEALLSFYLTTQSEQYQQLQDTKGKIQERLTELRKPLTSVMVMGDQTEPRATYVLNRGAYDSPTDRRVQPDTPAALPPLPAELPRDRLGLAKWLFLADHPLTARVAVNRYWQMLFGRGLVATPSDFGAQGEFPSHAKLLDWLAVDFRKSGWDIKQMLRKMVLSATYRQNAAVGCRDYGQDPENRNLARASRPRLAGETIRDTALQLSGLLVDRQGGPGVKPYQPPGLWAEVGLGGKPEFKRDDGEALYRRSLYTYWKRSAPPPAMQIFDAPTREKCTVARPRTNTPLQALVLLNDTQFVEASRCFAQRILLEAKPSDDAKISHAFRMATARHPRTSELEALLRLLRDAREHFGASEGTAQELLEVGASDHSPDLQVPELAAWTIVCSAIINLDETVTRN